MRMGKGTHRATDEGLCELFEAAEQRGRCLFAESRSQRNALRLVARAGSVISPWPGFYMRRTIWDKLDPRERHMQLIRALGKRHPGWVFCGPTAACAYDLQVSHSLLASINVCACEGTHSSNRGRLHYRVPAFSQRWDVGDSFVTSPTCTVFDCGRWLGHLDALAVADAALHKGLVTKGGLRSFVADHAGTHGIARARWVAQHVDGRAESGLESMVRARMIDLGYAIPELQVSFRDPLDPSRSYRVDMLVRRRDATFVAIEADGRVKYEDELLLGGRDGLAVILDERQREALLSSYGLEFMRLRRCDVLCEDRFARLMRAYRIPMRP